MVKRFTKDNLTNIRVAINEALEKVNEEFGVTCKIGNISYSDTEFRTKLEVRVDNGETAEDLAKKEFEVYAPMFGIPDDAFGKDFNFNGKVYTISGIKPKSRKYPIIGKEKGTNKSYKFPLNVVDGDII